MIAVNRRECGFSDQPRSRFRETHEEHEEKSAPVVFVIVVNARRAFVVLTSGGRGVSAADEPLTAGLAERGERTTTARVGVGLHGPERRL